MKKGKEIVYIYGLKFELGFISHPVCGLRMSLTAFACSNDLIAQSVFTPSMDSTNEEIASEIRRQQIRCMQDIFAKMIYEKF